MTKIHALRTGLVQVRRPQMASRGRGPARVAHMLFDDDWSDWLPVYAWAIEHDEGVIVVDTGETARGCTSAAITRAGIRSTDAPPASRSIPTRSSVRSSALSASTPATSGRWC